MVPAPAPVHMSSGVVSRRDLETPSKTLNSHKIYLQVNRHVFFISASDIETKNHITSLAKRDLDR